MCPTMSFSGFMVFFVLATVECGAAALDVPQINPGNNSICEYYFIFQYVFKHAIKAVRYNKMSRQIE
jgi:hypothetical protein